MQNKRTYPTERIVSIDRARGLLIICMILCQIAGRFGGFGFFGRIGLHGDGGLNVFPGYALADLGEPLFLLLLALSFWPSYQKRLVRDGAKAAMLHFLTRFTAIIGIGYIMRIAEFRTGEAYVMHVTKFVDLGVAGTCCVAVCGLTYLIGKLFKIKRLNVCGTGTIHLLSAMGIMDIIVDAYTVVAYTMPVYDTFNLDWWGALASIGASGIILLLFAGSNTLMRGISAAFMLTAYSLLHQSPGMMDYLDRDIQAGLLGVLSWGAMLLGYSVMADLFYADRANKSRGVRGVRAHTYEIGLAVLVALGIAGAVLLPVNKGSASPGYILASMPLSCLAFYLVSLTETLPAPRYPILCWWGKSPLLMYLMQYVLFDLAFCIFEAFDHIPFIIALLYLLLVFAGLTWLAYRLQKKEKTVRL